MTPSPSTTPFEAWIALLLFWTLAAVVFTQFITRYAFNDSASWTEEIARYLLIGTVFVGAAIGVAKNNHIQVDLLYRYLPRGVARTLSTFVDVARIAFFAAMVWFTVQMMMKMESYKMTIVDLPMNIVYGVCLFGFVGTMLRSCGVARALATRRCTSVLERPNPRWPTANRQDPPC